VCFIIYEVALQSLQSFKYPIAIIVINVERVLTIVLPSAVAALIDVSIFDCLYML
jgi:hypothetical protein